MAVIVSPITGKTISDISGVSGVMGLLYEDLDRIIEGAAINWRYPEFERTVSEWGGMLVEGRIPAASGTTVDKDTTAICGPYYFSVNAAYYDEWIEAVYPSEIRRIELTKILRGEMEYEDFLRKVVERNLNGFKIDVNASIDGMFVNTEASASLAPEALLETLSGKTTAAAALAGNGFLNPTGGTARHELLESTTWGDYFSEILKTCMHMCVENSTYTEGNDVYGANMSDLVIYLPIDVMAEADIKYLQNLFQLSGINKLPEIKTHNALETTFTDSDSVSHKLYHTFILEKKVINHVTRYMSYDEADINCRKSKQLDLHVEHMLKYSPLYKAWAISTEMPVCKIELVNP